jgi:hypothetical protein
MKWGWLFRTYVQWHAVAFLLSELCTRTKGEAVERAWRALEVTVGRWWFPFNNVAGSNKNQPGCLWKPLRKLLSKAQAAREKELALERASAAIRNGQQPYPGFLHGPNDMALPPLSTDQPSSENLDKMLRPAGPKLGETPSALSQSSWPSSPSVSLPRGQRSFSGTAKNPTATVQVSSMPADDSMKDTPKHEFADLLNYGFDNVMRGIIGDLPLDGTPIDQQLAYNPTMPNGMNMPQPTQAANMATTQTSTTNGSANSLQQAYGTFGNHIFADFDFNDMSPTMGQSTESPIMDGGNMDWTMWDDMVTQFGTEGQSQNVNSTNPASNIGLVNWF